MKARILILLAISIAILGAGYLLTSPSQPNRKPPVTEERAIVEPRRIPLH